MDHDSRFTKCKRRNPQTPPLRFNIFNQLINFNQLNSIQLKKALFLFLLIIIQVVTPATINAFTAIFLIAPVRLYFHSAFHPRSLKKLGTYPLERSEIIPSTTPILSARISGSHRRPYHTHNSVIRMLYLGNRFIIIKTYPVRASEIHRSHIVIV